MVDTDAVEKLAGLKRRIERLADAGHIADLSSESRNVLLEMAQAWSKLAEQTGDFGPEFKDTSKVRQLVKDLGLLEEPSEEQSEQPLELKRGVPLDDVSTKDLMQELTRRPELPDETRQRLLWDIADLGRPKWQDKIDKPESLPLELRHAPAPVFLKLAWPDEIDDKGRFYTQRIRHYDRPLMTAVEHYLANRKGREPLHAKGLTLITGPVPLEPKEKAKPARGRISAMHLRNS